jgi:hypothetical protein
MLEAETSAHLGYEPNEVEDAREAPILGALDWIVELMAEERTEARTIQDRFGGGYEIAYLMARNFGSANRLRTCSGRV